MVFKPPRITLWRICFNCFIIVYSFFDFLETNQKKFKDIILRLKILILVTIIIFLFRNIQRIDQEIEKYDYKPLKTTFYNVDQSHFRIQKILIY